MPPRAPPWPSTGPKSASKPPVVGSKARATIPKNWPPHLTYLTAPAYSPSLPAEIKRSLNPNNAHVHHPAHPALVIKPIKTPKHPANGQCGLFATKRIKAGEHLLDYLGYITVAPETSSTSDYSLSLDRYLGVSIDAEKMGNEARFTNDFRGIPGVVRPNAKFVDVERNGERRMGIQAERDIAKGEEVLVSYGKGFWSERMKESNDKEESPKKSG